MQATITSLAFILCLVFFLYDASLVLAAEPQSIPDTSSDSDTTEIQSETPESTNLDDESLTTQSVTESGDGGVGDSPPEEPVITASTLPDGGVEESVIESVESNQSSQIANASTTDEASQSDDSASSSNQENIPNESDGSSVTSTTTESEPSTNNEEELVTSETEPDDSNMVSVLDATTVSDNNYFQFSKSQCSQVADGSFYCFDQPQSEPSVKPTEDGVFSLLGSYGYLDIAIVRDGETDFITSNKFDDLAPMYDPLSNSIVWHRMIDDRYVIMSYDFKTKEETQLTEGKTNDMQPVRSGAVTVWQRWVGSTWQVIMLRGGVETQLSNSTFPNVGPSINGDFILWNTTNTTGDKQVVVYELSTGRSNVIDDDEGGYVSNPRFVLVYDTQLDNGDTITKGFDPLTGEVIPLAAVPTNRPSLPSPDPSGETRALINNKASTGREDYEEIDPFDPESFTPGTTTTNLASTTNETDSGVLEIIATTTEPLTPIELTEYDLVVVPFEVGASTTAAETVQ